MRVAFLGQPGSNSEEAALQYYGPALEALHCDSFRGMGDALEQGRAEQALLPIENSVAGSIHSNYDLLLGYSFQIVGELFFRVRNNLLALPGVELNDIRRVLSHPQPLAQCSAFISKLGVETELTTDTTVAARRLRTNNLRDTGAIASRRAAEVYELEILAYEIEDDAANYTRFIALSREPLPVASGQPVKTSIVFSVAHRPGALAHTLAMFADRGLNLTKIESRPLRGKPWEYLFYLDFVGDATVSRDALEDFGSLATSLRILGSYPPAASLT